MLYDSLTKRRCSNELVFFEVSSFFLIQGTLEQGRVFLHVIKNNLVTSFNLLNETALTFILLVQNHNYFTGLCYS